MATGTPTIDHWAKEISTPQILLSRDMVTAFMPLPAGVPIPPRAAPTGIPSIRALPKLDFPGSQLFFSSSGEQMPKKISAVGISARNMETKQVPSITLSRTNFALLPNIGRTYRERRLPRPTLEKIWPMIMVPSRKNTPVPAKPDSIVASVSKPTHAPKNKANMDVTAMGTASVSQRSTVTNRTRKPSQPA